MGITKFTATALLAIGATVIAAGSASATPAGASAAGKHGSVGYHTALAADGRSVVTTITAGYFAVSADSKTVTLTDRAGATVATLPMAYQVAGQKFALTPTVTANGRVLALTPIGAPIPSASQKASAQKQFIDKAAEDLARHQYNAAVGALIGLGLGILIGLFFFGVGAIPGAVIGAGLGALIGWAQP